jgi:hypothetical protein
MAGLFDPDDFDVTPRRKRPSRRDAPQAEVDLWLQHLESLLADVADDPEVADPLARVIARTKARQQVAAERKKRTFSSIDSLLSLSSGLDNEDFSPLDDDEEAEVRELEESILRDELGRGRSGS